MEQDKATNSHVVLFEEHIKASAGVVSSLHQPALQDAKKDDSREGVNFNQTCGNQGSSTQSVWESESCCLKGYAL